MARLQELLGQSLVQSLGLRDVLSQRERESQQLAQTAVLRGQLGAEQIRGASRQKRGLFETIGTVVGATGGFLFGGPQGAALGARLGQVGGGAVSGQAPDPRASQVSRGIQGAIGLSQQLGEQQRAGEIAGRRAEADIAQTVARTGLLEAQRGQLEQQQRVQPAIRELERQVDLQEALSKKEDVLRKEFNPIKKTFDEIANANQKISSALNRKSAAGDLAAVFSFMKVLDPGSVVREGEQATAKNAAGVPERIRSQYNKTLTGETLSQAQRDDFRRTSRDLFKTESNTFLGNINRLRTVAENRDLNQENVFGQIFFDSADEAERANLPIGTTIFIDGRPAVIQ